MRRSARVALLGVVLGACGREQAPAPVPRPAPAAGNRLNVLLITIDTLRADHLGAYGYPRSTSPRMDALGREGTVFEHAFTYWPKTRPSFVMILTGRRPSQNGYSHRNPVLLGFNPTLASTLKAAGYATAAIVDNANVAKALGYAKGFDSYREIWEEKEVRGEWQGTQAISDGGIRFLREASREHPFFLWLHYVNPHAPYTPPAPYDTAFLGAEARSGPSLPIVPGFNGGIPRALYVRDERRLGYYVAQYDGEIAAVDGEIGRVLDALRASSVRGSTLVVLTSDHGESLGEHAYFFDHGQDLFDPCLSVPLIVAAPGGPAGNRSRVLASTLDIVPTVLDAVKVPYPPDLAGTSLMGAVRGGRGPDRPLLFAQNDHDMTAAVGARFKLIATYTERGPRYALYDRASDPGETRDASRVRPEDLRVARRELETYVEATDREWGMTRRLLADVAPGEGKLSYEACERLKALGYVQGTCPQ